MSEPSVLRLTFVFGAASFAGAFALRALDPASAELGFEFGAPPERIALLATAFSLPYALIQPILGPIADATGKRRMVTIALLVLAVMLCLGALAPSFGWLMAARVLAGMAAGGVLPVTLAIMGDAVPMAQRQVAISRLLVFAITGQIAGGALAGVLTDLMGWRGVILLCAGVALAAGLFILNELRRGMAEPRGRFDAVLALRRYRGIVGNPTARFLFATVAVEGALIYGIFPYIAPILHARGLGGVAEAGLAIGAFGAGGIVYALVASMLLRRLGQSRMVLLGGALGAAGLAAVGLAPALTVAVIGMLAVGTGFYMIHNSIQTRVTELAPQARASAVSLHAFCFFGGQSLGPVAYGEAMGGLGAAPALLIAGGLLVALSLIFARRPE